MKPFHRGLVVGKFSPLHRGHEHLLRSALSDCSELVVIAYNKPEFAGCESERKARWFRELFPEIRALVLDDDNLTSIAGTECSFRSIPAETEAAEVHRRFVSEVYSRAIGQPLDAIFTSELYGPPFTDAVNKYFATETALAPNVVHREVDLPRVKVPISASRIRENVHALREYLSPEVYSDFVTRVCFLGAESTGKSTLTELAASRYNTAKVDEYGRELYVEKGGKLDYEDLTLIARRHVNAEEKALREAQRYLFVDTSPLTTLFYSEAMFGRASDELKQRAERRYDLTFLCMPDIPFVQDSTRVDEEFRRKQHEWYLRELARRKIEYTELSGDITARLGKLDKILTEKTV